MKEYGMYLFRYFILSIATVVIIFFWQDTVLITSILIILAVLINCKSSKKEIILYIFVAVLAPLVESISIITGACVYSHQDIWNVPLWLPFYWGMGGIAIKDTYLIIQKIVK